jgi:GNAT superfamily N-acetyltransferase
MVRSGLRGRGVGAALMVRVEHEAQAAGRTLLFLDPSAGASGAAEFYRRLGYAAVGTVAAAGAGQVHFKQLPARPPATSVPFSSYRRVAALG